MTIEVIAAGLGRNATLSMKFALEALGFGPCHHMTEVFAGLRRQVPLWLDAADGLPDWDAIFAGFRSTSDYPSASFWREIAAYYPDAKVVLTTRSPDAWYESVSGTIFAPSARESWNAGLVGPLMEATIFDRLPTEPDDRPAITDWYAARNAEVVASLSPDRLLVFDPADGWEPLCAFLGRPRPSLPFPRTNQRTELGTPTARGGPIGGPETQERMARLYIESMRSRAFSRSD